MITIVHFHDNPTSIPIDAMKVQETWHEVNSVGLSHAVTTEYSTAVEASYESADERILQGTSRLDTPQRSSACFQGLS